jgi:hypothetical protein
MEQEVHSLNTPKLVYWERQGRYQTVNEDEDKTSISNI